MEREASKSQVPTLILAVLSHSPLHGYAIARRIEERSDNALQVGEGSLYPVLKSLERQQLVQAQWEIQEGPPRKVYTITEAGREELARLSAEWKRYRNGFDNILGGSLSEQTA